MQQPNSLPVVNTSARRHVGTPAERQLIPLLIPLMKGTEGPCASPGAQRSQLTPRYCPPFRGILMFSPHRVRTEKLGHRKRHASV